MPRQLHSPRSADVLFRLARADISMASVRYRGLAPALALKALGWSVALSAGRSDEEVTAPLAIAVKPLSEAESDWALRWYQTGGALLVDLCDNVFVDGYGGADVRLVERFRRVAARGGALTVPTEALAEVVADACHVAPERIFVVPDVVETPGLVDAQVRLLGGRSSIFPRGPHPLALRLLGLCASRRRPVLLWFGNHGAPWGRFGLSDLLLFEDALRVASQRYGAMLWVVSNKREAFDAVARKLPIECRYFEWTPKAVDRALAAADVCVVPNSLDEFSRTKSANRPLKALAAGVPVIATPTRACARLEGAIWLADPAAGIDAYLGDERVCAIHLAEAREIMRRDYSIEALGTAVLKAARCALEAT
jgi:glycosyltransferase involved in cell wall biosynthesis